MPRNIVNKPHPTPNPDKLHTPGSIESIGDSSGARRSTSPPYRPADDKLSQGDRAADEPTYDSCFDDLNLILSQSIEQPDPDPNLESPVPSVRLSRDETAPLLQPDRGKTPRTSEIFRTVVAAAANLAGKSDQPAAPVHRPAQPQPSAEPEVEQSLSSEEPQVDLGVVEREERIQNLASQEADQLSEPPIFWTRILLMSYASAITLALVWLLWTGRWSRTEAPTTASPDQPVVDSSPRVVEPTPVPPAQPIPPENRAGIGQTIRLGELEVTPMRVVSTSVVLIRSIEPRKRRREEGCLVLRLKLTNVSTEHTFVPLDGNLVRERGLRPHDPYITTSEGATIRLFPLALDSEWTIVGQKFATLRPGETVETFVAAEPGSAQTVAAEMTWRVRLRTSVYSTDMLGVPFSKNEVRRVGSWHRDIEFGFP